MFLYKSSLPWLGFAAFSYSSIDKGCSDAVDLIGEPTKKCQTFVSAIVPSVSVQCSKRAVSSILTYKYEHNNLL